MKYVFNQRNKPQNDKNMFRNLTAILRILPATLLLILAASLIVSARTTFLRPAASTSQSIIISSPQPDANVSGTMQLQASLAGQSASAYDMFWYVDNGQWNWMSSTADEQAKQASINLNGWTWHLPSTAYTITVVSVMHSNSSRSYSGVQIHTSQASTPTMTTSPTATTTQTSQSLYVNPTSNAATTAASTSDPTMKRVMTKLAGTPTATWLGSWNSNVQTDVQNVVNAASSAHQVPVFVAYNIPNRDCGGYSSGGAASADSYKTWIQSVAAGIGSSHAIVIVEPDALAQTTCLSGNELSTREQLLTSAIATLKAHSGVKAYLDAGNPNWIPAGDMASRLQTADINQADGFSLNVSNFFTTSANVAYGSQVSQLLNGKHFVIDTSRNGNGSNGEWCNPSGRALGNAPTSSTGNPLVDDYLWIKTPGESDGTCNGGPAAGAWWPSYALTLATNAGW